MNQTAIPKSARRAVRAAVRYFRRAGLGAPPPVDEIAILESDGEAGSRALAEVLAQGESRDLPAAVHLARAMRAKVLSGAVAEAALQRAAPLEAKFEAVKMLRDSGLDIPAQVNSTVALAEAFLDAPDVETLDRILALTDAWRIPILEHWLAHKGAAEVDLLCRAFGQSAAIDALVVRRLGASANPDAVEPLQRLAGSDDKVIGKLARRALHQLRSAGVDAAARSPGSSAPFSMEIEPDVRHETRAFVSGIDGAGARIVWMLAPSPTGGQRLLEAVVDDTAGLRKADVLSVTRTDFRNHIERLRSNPAILVVQAEVPAVVGLLMAAEEKAAASGAKPGDAYESWRAEVASALFQEPEETPSQPAIYERIPLAQVQDRRELVKESVELLGEPFFSNWALAGEVAEAAARGVRDAETSKLVLDEEQRKQQVDSAVSDAATSFDAELRQRYRERLEAMAEVLWVSKRRDQARLALAAAVGLSEIADLYSDHPFARALIQRGVLVAYQRLREQEEQRASDSPIITP